MAAAAATVAALNAALDLVIRLITALDLMPDTPEGIKAALPKLKARLEATKAEVAAVPIKDV